jgi:uncharacterized protein YndB with AHSA1/START domain
MSRAPAQSDPAGDYGRALVVAASPERMFDAIATLDGLKRWWTPRASGSDRPGGTLRLEFEGLNEHIELCVIACHRPTEVVWSVLKHTSLEEWTGTTIDFALSPRGSHACAVEFRHQGLSPRLGCYDDCEAGWNHFLSSLVSLIERGAGTPFGA